MKRLWIFFILIVLAGGTGKALSSNNEAAKDSLLQILDTLPADSSRLEMLYSLAYLDPMSPSCVYYLGKLLEEATTQDNKYYQCLALYAHVVYYFNHQDEFESITEYVDDGHTGTDANREDFQRLLSDVMSGKINCVIVKDLSRFARNYSDAGSLIDNLFVQMGVRFISLAENVDSYPAGAICWGTTI